MKCLDCENGTLIAKVKDYHIETINKTIKVEMEVCNSCGIELLYPSATEKIDNELDKAFLSTEDYILSQMLKEFRERVGKDLFDKIIGPKLQKFYKRRQKYYNSKLYDQDEYSHFLKHRDPEKFKEKINPKDYEMYYASGE